MNIDKKIKEFKINEEEYVMFFDMNSIRTYVNLSGQDFNKGLVDLFTEKAETFIYFLASTIRRKEEENKPLGEEIINGDVLYWLLNYRSMLEEIVISSLPQENKSKKK